MGTTTTGVPSPSGRGTPETSGVPYGTGCRDGSIPMGGERCGGQVGGPQRRGPIIHCSIRLNKFPNLYCSHLLHGLLLYSHVYSFEALQTFLLLTPKLESCHFPALARNFYLPPIGIRQVQLNLEPHTNFPDFRPRVRLLPGN